MIFCYRGKSCHPPENLRKGDVVADGQGRRWAYTGESRDESREAAIFVLDQPASGLEPVRIPTCQPMRIIHPPQGPIHYEYSPQLRVVRSNLDGGKTFSAEFFRDGYWHKGAGPDTWPFYGTANGDVAIEVEGEKCVEILLSVGIPAITHPGHQRTREACVQRYEELVRGGAGKVYYISDNDKPGRQKATAFQSYAQEAGLEFVVIPAETIFDVPGGGSVDDMPQSELRDLIVKAIQGSQDHKLVGVKTSSFDRRSYAKVLADLRGFAKEAPVDAGFVAGIADIAESNGVQYFEVRKIWDQLQEDNAIASEALGACTSILRRQELSLARKRIKLDDYLPLDVCPAIEEMTSNLSCDPLTAIATVLATAAGVFKAGHLLDGGDGKFVKSPIIWVLVSGYSGSGKSPIMTLLSYDRLRLVFNHFNRVSEERDLQYETRYALLPRNQRPERPEPLATAVENFTTESLNAIIADNHSVGLGTLLYSEEVKQILGNFDEHKARGKGRGREMFLGLADGKVSTSYRVGRRTKMIAGRVQNGLLGAIQPGVFRQMIADGDDAGLFARCLVVPIPTGFKELNFSRTPEEITAVKNAELSLEGFYLKCLELEPRVLRLDREAVELFAKLARNTYDRSQAVALDSQKAVLGKRLGYALQVALAMHLCRAALSEPGLNDMTVGAATLAKAIIFVDILQGYAIVEQQESQMQRTSFDLPRRIHEYAAVSSGCTTAEFCAACVPMRSKKEIKAGRVKTTMDQLVAMGLGEWRDMKFFSLGEYPG